MNSCFFESKLFPCKPHPHETFKGFICEAKLEDAFGLCLKNFEFHSITDRHVVGPYLTPSKYNSFEPNEVIVPAKPYFDYRFANATDGQGNYHTYKMNRKLVSFVNRMAQVGDNPDARPGIRFLYELFRNFLNADNDKINIGFLEEGSRNVDLKTLVETRMCQTKARISNSVTEKLAGKINLNQNGEPATLPFKEIPTLMKPFLVTMNYDTHESFKPSDDQTLITELNSMNVKYVKEIGIVALRKILHPNVLTMWGTQQADSNFYNTKVMSFGWEVAQPEKLTSKNHPDKQSVDKWSYGCV